jgi:toxin ParE1/3/4
VKPIVRREQADRDVLAAIDYYLEHAPEAALSFINAIEQTYRRIQRLPAIGSPRYAHELNLPGLRFQICKRYPFLVFYMETSARIDVWRVLHASRDIPAYLQDGIEESER